MTSGISAPLGITNAGYTSPTSPFTPNDSQLNAARVVAAASMYASRRKKKDEEDMREPSEILLDKEYQLEPVTSGAPPARTHQK